MEKEGYPEPRDKRVVGKCEENAGQENHFQGEEPGSNQVALSTPGMGVAGGPGNICLEEFQD